MNKKDLIERDICSKFIGPALKRAGWDGMMRVREEVAFTKPSGFARIHAIHH
jgi:type I site-specific restriction endonuclease